MKTIRLLESAFRTAPDRHIILIRLVVGLVFLSEGIQKFLFPELAGTGCFLKIGFIDPAFCAYFTGTFEILCGTLMIPVTNAIDWHS